MNRSFLDDPDLFIKMAGFLLGIATLGLLAGSIQACNRTPEEQAAFDARTLRWVKEDLVTFSPRAGVECYVLRGSSSSNPRVMSCVGTLPVTHGN